MENNIIAILKSAPTSYEREIYKIFETNHQPEYDFGFYVKNRKTKKIYSDKFLHNRNVMQVFFSSYLHRNELIVGCYQSDLKQPTLTRQRVYTVFDGVVYNYETLKEKYKLKKIETSSELIGSLYLIKYTANGNNLEKTICSMVKELEGNYFVILFDDLLQKMIVINKYQDVKVSYKKYDHYFICYKEPEDMFYDFRNYPFLLATIVDYKTTKIEKHINI